MVNFEYLKNNLGFNLIDKDKVVEFMGKSPFDLTNQELWYLPKDAVPGNDENFEATMTNQIEKNNKGYRWRSALFIYF